MALIPRDPHPTPTTGAERVVVVIAGGEPVDASHARHVPPGAPVVAADSGVAAAETLGCRLDVVVGDLDSAEPVMVERARRAGARIERHPVAKDATDLELAMGTALDLGAQRVVVLGGAGGRLDHLLGGLLLLGAPAWADVEVVAYVGPATLTVVRREAELAGTPGELVSLLALHGPAHGITTEGLRYPLHGEALSPGSTRGVSNELTASRARIRLTSGVLLAVQPGVSDPPPPSTRGTP